MARSSDIDLAYIYGYGFPPAKAGTCTWWGLTSLLSFDAVGGALIASGQSILPACRLPLKLHRCVASERKDQP